MKLKSVLCFALWLTYLVDLKSQTMIGSYTYTFQDPNRANRTIETAIYYPAQSNGNNAPILPGQYPVIVFGHGFSMNWDAYQNIWEALVPQGYIMAFPKTESSLFSTDHQQFGWDLQFLVDAMQAESGNIGSPIFQSVLSATALMGHSMGGGAAFLAADSLSSNGNAHFKTIIGLAPAESSTNGVSSINSALNVMQPCLIFSGEKDGVTPPADHHLPIYNNVPACKSFVSINGGAHCYFANPNFNCDFGESVSSFGISISRSTQQDIMYGLLLPWLDYYLKGNCSADTVFQDSLSISTRITAQQSCTAQPSVSIIDSSGTLTTSLDGTAYQWMLNGNIINGANGPQYIPNQIGDYAVAVYFQGPCPSISPLFFVGSTTTIIHDEKSIDFEIFPNPVENLLFINAIDHQKHNLDIEIYNQKGKLIKKITMIDFQETAINLNDIEHGIYFLILRDKQSIFNQYCRFIKI